jgi:predicted enzyme related to lactoylglutathione lyase
MNAQPFLGIYTAIYRVPDLDAAKAWYAGAFGVQPYFDEPFYVGFEVSGFELGLQPLEGESAGVGGVVAYWGVADAAEAVARLTGAGAAVHAALQEVGGGIRVATVKDPWGNPIGVIENPHFKR